MTLERKEMNEAFRLAAWLRANAKHMGNPFEINQMLRAAVIMELLAGSVKEKPSVQKPEIIRGGKRIPVSDLRR
jgi:hypothetical protein